MTTVPNPFQPVAFRTATPGHAPDHPPIGRLRRAGLQADEIESVKDDWAKMTEDERLGALEALSNLTDEELRADIEDSRALASEADGER